MVMPEAIAVAIPARDEEAHMVACLRSVNAAARRVDLPVHIVVAADSCHDGTAELAALALADLPGNVGSAVLRVKVSCAGGARQAAAAEAVERTGRPLDRVWLATTDADSTVPPAWLERQLAWAAGGADGVAGLVRLDRTATASLRTRARLLQARLGAGVGHPHVYGANLGVDAGRWAAAGGFPHVAVGEDQALWRALSDDGCTLVAVDDIVVTTSGRLVGRAPSGFASVLAALDAGDAS